MAQAYMKVIANGSRIDGLCIQTSFAGEDITDYWEVISYEHTMSRHGDSGARASGRIDHKPVKVTRRIDKASPLLVRALCHNEIIEAEIKFGRPSLAGDGTNEIYHKINIEGGRIVHIQQRKADINDPEIGRLPDLEEIWIAYDQITWEAPDVSVLFTHQWSDQS